MKRTEEADIRVGDVLENKKSGFKIKVDKIEKRDSITRYNQGDTFVTNRQLKYYTIKR